MASGVKQMQSDLREARENIRADLKEARTAWQGLAGTIQIRQGGTEIPLKAEAPAGGEITDLETKLLAAVNKHPEGINLAGIANSLGVAPVVLGRISKSLIEKGKICKEEKLYFPASEGEAGQGFRFRPPLRSRRGNS
jgi:hypothetical protein